MQSTDRIVSVSLHCGQYWADTVDGDGKHRIVVLSEDETRRYLAGDSAFARKDDNAKGE